MNFRRTSGDTFSTCVRAKPHACFDTSEHIGPRNDIASTWTIRLENCQHKRAQDEEYDHHGQISRDGACSGQYVVRVPAPPRLAPSQEPTFVHRGNFGGLFQRQHEMPICSGHGDFVRDQGIFFHLFVITARHVQSAKKTVDVIIQYTLPSVMQQLHGYIDSPLPVVCGQWICKFVCIEL